MGLRASALAAVSALVLLGVYGVQRFNAWKVESRSVAVLPFVNVKANAQDQYLADGLTEDVIDELSQGSSLRVIERASSKRFSAQAP